jgi:hypothetical protein
MTRAADVATIVPARGYTTVALHCDRGAECVQVLKTPDAVATSAARSSRPEARRAFERSFRCRQLVL